MKTGKLLISFVVVFLAVCVLSSKAAYADLSCGNFQDVDVHSVFKPFIQCLVCNDSISGYLCTNNTPPDNLQCVRPQNLPFYLPDDPTTRQQLMRFISENAHFIDSIPNTQQTYTDVLHNNVFWLDIERGTRHNVISGYECGGTNPITHTAEPCDAQRRPYFRPANNVTRAQAVKIIVTTKGYTTTIPSGQRTFADIAPADFYYPFVEKAAINGLISGYACGGTNPITHTAEPCDAQHRPYFRPSEEFTRQHAAKLIAVAFQCVLPTQGPTNTPIPFFSITPTATNTPVPTSPPVPGGHRISGQVLNVGLETPAQCPTSGYPGLNGVVVSATLAGTQQRYADTTHTGNTQQLGAYYIEGVPDGIYNVCIDVIDAHYQLYCTVQSWQPPVPTPARDPFQSKCTKVTVVGADVESTRLIVKTAVQTSTTPPGSCAFHARGDANCDGTIDLKDYFYYVRKINNAVIPSTVDLDFDNNHLINDADRQIIVNTLNGDSR